MDGVDMVVEVRGAELSVDVPAVPGELVADDLARAVGVRQGAVKGNRGAVDGGDAARLERVGLIDADPAHRTDGEAGGVGDCHRLRARGHRRGYRCAFGAE